MIENAHGDVVRSMCEGRSSEMSACVHVLWPKTRPRADFTSHRVCGVSSRRQRTAMQSIKATSKFQNILTIIS